MLRSRQGTWSVLAILSVLVWHWVGAQTTTASLVGTVRDETRAILPGVALTVTNRETGAVRTAITGDSGEYVVRDLAPGEYEVQAELPGFSTAVRSGIKLTVGRQALLDIELKVGEVSEKVVVQGDAALVDTVSSTLRGLVDDRKIRDLPLNGRSFEQLALLQPGVVAYYGTAAQGGGITGSGQRISVGGARPTSNNFMLDGTNINDTGNATPASIAGVNLGVEAIREFEILTSTYDATFGRNAGAVINVVTKSGTNEFHGTVFEFHRNSALDARNFFDLNPKNPAVRSSPPPFKRNQFGFALGGPIKKDKIFIFGNYEGFRERLGLSNIALVPTAAARQGILPTGNIAVHPGVRPYLDLYPLPNGRDFGDGTGEFLSSPSQPLDEDYFVIRYDQQFSASDSLFVRYTFDDATKTTPDRILIFPGENVTRRQYVTVEQKHIFSPTILNTARFGFNRSFSASDVQEAAAKAVNPALSLIPGDVFGLFNFAAQVTGGPATIANLGPGGFSVFAWNSFQYSDDLSYSSGRNSVRVGVSIDRLQHNFTNAAFARGRYSINSLQDFLLGRSRQFETYLPGSQIFRGMRTTQIGVYVQDDFRWRPNLTLNLGLRYETMTTPQEVNGLQSQLVNVLDPQVVVGEPYFNHPGHVFQPRIGVAWDVSGNGRTSLRAGLGTFADVLVGSFWVNSAVNAQPFNVVGTAFNPPPEIFPRAFELVARAGLPSIIRDTPDAKFPTRAQYNLTLQHELLPQTVLTIAYTGGLGRHGVRTGESNTAIPAIVDGKQFWAPGLRRRNPNFGFILTHNTDANSSYNSLQVSMNRRFSQGLQLQGAYTWGNSIDDGSQQWGSEGRNNPQNHTDLYNRLADRGASIFDIRHNFSFNATYELPFGPGRPFGSNLRGVANQIVGGWQINSILALATGHPVTLITGFNRSRSLDTRNPDRPDLVSGRSNNPVLGGPDRYFDPTAFALPPAGFNGNLGRSTLRGPGLVVLDFGLSKSFDIREGVRAQFRSEFFNLPNRANFATPLNRIFTPTGAIVGSAGRINSTATTSRQIQFGLKITF